MIIPVVGLLSLGAQFLLKWKTYLNWTFYVYIFYKVKMEFYPPLCVCLSSPLYLESRILPSSGKHELFQVSPDIPFPEVSSLTPQEGQEFLVRVLTGHCPWLYHGTYQIALGLDLYALIFSRLWNPISCELHLLFYVASILSMKPRT